MKSYDVIIVGGGIAGLTAAIYLKRSNKNVLLIEKFACGGQILSANEIANYPAFESISGYELIEKVLSQAKKLGAEIVFENATKLDLKGDDKTVKTLSNEYSAKNVILAMGVSNKKLGLSNEEELVGSGISYCATCDGAFFKKKDVAVIGSGATAKTDIEYLKNIANKVYAVTDKNLDDFSDDKTIEVIGGSVTELLGNPLKGVRITLADGAERVVDVAAAFVAVGHTPNTALVKGQVDLDEKGYIITDENMKTNLNGVYAAGDIRQKRLKQLVTAASDGAIAAKLYK